MQKLNEAKNMKYLNCSKEHLDIIEVNECNGNQSLVTKRFEALFNEVERLREYEYKYKELCK